MLRAVSIFASVCSAGALFAQSDAGNVTAGVASDLNTALAENAVLRSQLAAVAGEAEVFRRKSGELTLRLEALGTGTNDARLVELVSNLSLVEKNQAKLKESLIGLSEAVMRYEKVSTTDRPDARVDLEEAVRSARQVLGTGSNDAFAPVAASATITDGQVISMRDDLNLVVANLGASQGVRVGMPFQVMRGDQVVATVQVVDVRNKIAGALIQNVEDRQAIKVGDRLKVTATQ